jgi:hypothetical protein
LIPLVVFVVAGIVLTLLNQMSCNSEKIERKKIRDVDFTLVEEGAIPEELIIIIEQSKKELIKKTYSDKENLYIVIGYGKQPTTGYSIRVIMLYESKNAIHIKTELNGPKKDELISMAPTYPYIVIKIENTEKRVVFK